MLPSPGLLLGRGHSHIHNLLPLLANLSVFIFSRSTFPHLTGPHASSNLLWTRDLSVSHPSCLPDSIGQFAETWMCCFIAIRTYETGLIYPLPQITILSAYVFALHSCSRLERPSQCSEDNQRSYLRTTCSHLGKEKNNQKSVPMLNWNGNELRQESNWDLHRQPTQLGGLRFTQLI